MYVILDKAKPHTENKRLKLRGGHLYNRSSVDSCRMFELKYLAEHNLLYSDGTDCSFMLIVYRLPNCKTHVTYIFDVNNGKLLDREWQITDPISRQRGRPKKTRQQISENNLRTGSNIWSQVPEWTRYLHITTDWPSVVMWLWLWHQDILTDWLTDRPTDRQS
jgi:hypothetical protein